MYVGEWKIIQSDIFKSLKRRCPLVSLTYFCGRTLHWRWLFSSAVLLLAGQAASTSNQRQGAAPQPSLHCEYLSRDLNTGLWLVNTGHMTWTLAFDWAVIVTWPEYWPLIGRWEIFWPQILQPLFTVILHSLDCEELTSLGDLQRFTECDS